MRGKKLVIYCEVCGSDTLSCTTDFITFHHLNFCSPDCRDEYRFADEQRLSDKGDRRDAPARRKRPDPNRPGCRVAD
jgi:hypothetical protein